MIIRRCLLMSDLNVLWIVNEFPDNANSDRLQYLWHSLEALQKSGVKPYILLTESWKPFRKKQYSNIPFPIKKYFYFSIPRHYFRFISNLSYLLFVIPRIKRLLKENHFDVIHAHGEICGLAAVRISKNFSIPSVVTIHGIDTCKRLWTGLSKKMFYRVYNEASKIIFVGDPLKKNFQFMLSYDHHCRVVYNGMKLPRQRVSLKENKTIQIISVSNLHEGKGIDLTLKALANLKLNGVENWHYTIIGDGDQKKYLTDLVQNLRLDKDVSFLGNCTHDVVYEHLSRSHIFCLPSYREAFGIAYLEAMAHGLVAIGVKKQGPCAFIKHSETGFLVEPHNIDDLVSILTFVLTHFVDMPRIAEAGKNHVLSYFTWEKHAKNIMDVYKSVGPAPKVIDTLQMMRIG